VKIDLYYSSFSSANIITQQQQQQHINDTDDHRTTPTTTATANDKHISMILPPRTVGFPKIEIITIDTGFNCHPNLRKMAKKLPFSEWCLSPKNGFFSVSFIKDDLYSIEIIYLACFSD
jgi:hypothetical protein